MRAIAIAILLVAAAARAGDVAPLVLGKGTPAKLGASTLTAAPCTLDGPPLVFHERYVAPHGMVRAPNGDLVLLDDDNHVRRYRPKAGKGCAFAIDKTFGKDGVLDLGLGTGEHAYPRLAVDADGTIYVSNVPQQPWRIRGNKVDAMCGDKTRVNASPRSKIVWRYEWATEATRQRGDCSGAASAYLDGGFFTAPAKLWVIDDRAVGYGDDDDRKNIFVVFGADGKPAGRLDVPDGSVWLTPDRFARCGAAICALAFEQLALWGDAGALLGTAKLETLIGASGAIASYDLAPGDGEAYLLLRSNAVGTGADRYEGAIVRIDGFPR